MPGDIHVKGGVTTTIGAVRSDCSAASGKFSSILKYLDHVSAGDDTLRQQQCSTSNDDKTAVIPRVVVTDVFDVGSLPSSTSSSISSSGSPQQQYNHRGGRRRRPRHSKSSSQSPQTTGRGGESKLTGGGTRAAWDNSTKGYNKVVMTSSSMRDSTNGSRGDLSAPSGRRRRRPEAADIVQRSQPPTTDRTSRNRDHRTRSNPTARDRTSSHPHPDVVNRRYSAAVGRELSPLPDADRTVDDGWKRGGSTLDFSTAGTEAPTATVGGIAQQRQRQRRWVWDEWDGNASGSPSPPSLHRGTTATTTTTVSSSGRSMLGRHSNNNNNRRAGSSSGPNVSPPAAGTTTTTSDTASADTFRPRLDSSLPGQVVVTDYAPAEHRHGNRTWSPQSRRGSKDRSAAAIGVDDDEAASTPAARRAFEDVQATARSMKANLKERRSEVGVTYRCRRC